MRSAGHWISKLPILCILDTDGYASFSAPIVNFHPKTFLLSRSFTVLYERVFQIRQKIIIIQTSCRERRNASDDVAAEGTVSGCATKSDDWTMDGAVIAT